MNITGTLIKNFFHCRRQAYLYYFNLNFRNEFMRLGELKHFEHNSQEFSIDNIKIDKMNNSEIIEFKKTSSNLDGSIAQLLFYLYVLKKKGIKRNGVLKDLSFGNEYFFDQSEENMKKIEGIIKEIELFFSETKNIPPKKKLRKECKNCSFFDFCWC